MTKDERDKIIGTARRTKSLMHREEMEYLCDLADRAPDGAALEIGVYMGAALIAGGLTRYGRGVALGVDDWSYKDIPELKTKCNAALQLAGVGATLFDMTSEEAAKDSLIPNSLSFLFLDGDHTRKFVEQDIALWIPRLISGGIVVFHDYGRRKNNCAVTEVVDHWNLHNNWIPLGTQVTTTAFMKP